ncbi:blastula protease 10-like [Penaeus chinensis]|uniref:blastula protease 10-like n=1 Tax=Penaeus chinensis TaxID=139456 RepID=UPI001FB7D65B|nr:blastula protease 10-like [Penaeus chinensis]
MCSDVVATSSVGVIISPGYPGTYTNFLDCTLTVTVATSTAISFDYLSFNLEKHPTCSYDFLTINDTINTERTRYCETTPPDFPLSATNDVSLRFFTDKSVIDTGFYICYKGV